MKCQTLNNVGRVEGIAARAFIEDYVCKEKPVIILNSQEGMPISGLNTQEKAVENFASLPIQVQQNYTSPLVRAKNNVRSQGLSRKVRNDISLMSLGDYASHIRAQPQTDLLCVEYPTPKEVMETLVVPSYCQFQPAGEDVVSFLFVANQGNYAHLHFDGDYRNVFLYQVFGRKRIVMIPMRSVEKICPSMNFSKLLIQSMGESEKLKLFEYLGAYDCLLEPGEMIFFPASIWHYVEYIDTGMSVNFRFGRDAFSRQLVDANRVPFYPDLHLILSCLNKVEDPQRKNFLQNEIWRESSSVLAAEYATTHARHQAAQALYRRMLVTYFGDAIGKPTMVYADCAIAEAMAIERYESTSLRWREELQLSEPL